LEIGDVFAINKADREGADKLNTEIAMMLDLNPVKVDWRPPIKRTVASQSEGISDLMQTIQDHIAFLEQSGELTNRRTKRTRNELIAMVDEQIGRYIMQKVTVTGEFDRMVESVHNRDKDPYSVVNSILSTVLR